MERVRFAGDEEDDLYGGFDFPDTALNTEVCLSPNIFNILLNRHHRSCRLIQATGIGRQTV